MEMAICIFDKPIERLNLQAKAVSLIWPRLGIKRNKSMQIRPGRNQMKNNLKNISLHLRKVRTLYLYTDGITDQLGGEKRKRFMKNLARII